jgi:hypothetical protein
LSLCADPEVDLDAEQAIILDAFKEIAGKHAARFSKALENGEDLEIPDFLKRKDGGHE